MSATALPLALGFVNPLVLSGLALAAIPIIIHWLSRRRFRLVDWAATRFLLEAERENRRRLRFEQWLLVALRCLVVALLALVFARPFVQPGLLASLVGGRGNVERIIVLDDSASLAFKIGAPAEFVALREAAARLLSWLHHEAPHDPVTLYLTSRPDEPLVARGRLGDAAVQELAARVLRLEPSVLRAQPRRVAAAVAAQIEALGPAAAADIYVLSDFQRSEWAPAGPSGRGVFADWTRLENDNVRAVLIASGHPSRDNLAIVDLALDRPQVVAGMPCPGRVTVANYGRLPSRAQMLQVALDQAPIPSIPVESVPPGEQRTVSFEAAFPDAGWSQLAAEVAAGDGLPMDDSRTITTEVRPHIRVLLVDGEPDADPAADEVHLLRSALAPPGPYSSGVQVDVIDASALPATPLEPYQCVDICNLPAPAPGVADALAAYVRGGGGLAIFVGDLVIPESYNEMFSSGADPLLPLPLESIHAVGAGTPGAGLVRTTEHPVTAAFAGAGASAAENVRFRKWIVAKEETDAEPAGKNDEPDAGDRPRVASATVLARFADAGQSPALVERRVGAGRVLLFLSTADPEWNDWPRTTDGSYVVTMLEMTQHLARRSEAPGAFVAGDVLRVHLDAERFESRAVFKSPKYPAEPAFSARAAEGPRASSGGSVQLDGPVATHLGVYTVELHGRSGENEVRPLAVNLDSDESDLTPASAAELSAALGPVAHTFVPSADAFLRGAEESRREIWPALISLAAVVLLAEQALACWFGSERRVAAGGIMTLLRRARFRHSAARR